MRINAGVLYVDKVDTQVSEHAHECTFFTIKLSEMGRSRDNSKD